MLKPAVTGAILVLTILAFGSVTKSQANVLPVLPGAVVNLQDGNPADTYSGPLLSPSTTISSAVPGGYDVDTAYGNPSPGIEVSLKSSAVAFGSADLKYYFEYVGPANLSIPINISGSMIDSPIAITESMIVTIANSNVSPLIVTPDLSGGGGMIPFDSALNVPTNTEIEVELQAEGATNFNGSPTSGLLEIDPIISISSLFPQPQALAFDESSGIGNLSFSTPEPGLYALLASLGIFGVGVVRRHKSFLTQG